MRIYKNPLPELWSSILQRPVAEKNGIEKTVGKILGKVKDKGDKSIRRFTKELDGVKIKELEVSSRELKKSASLLNHDLKLAIAMAKENIEKFHASQTETVSKTESMPGISCWRQSVPIEKVGFYIPGGSAPLFSTVLMLAIPASIAGCQTKILCTPPGPDGSIHPAILYSAQLCGIDHIYKIGGAQAIAAMAYGTKTVPRVQKIFGPGNQYVTVAKQLVQKDGIAIDMPAGPSELLIIADDTADPEWIAADLLSQAEHGIDSQVILISTNETIVTNTITAVENQLNSLSRKEIAEKALAHSRFFIVDDLSQAFDLSNLYAPEHLILACNNAEQLIPQVKSAGSVFLGHYSPESVGDYASGTNHTLPTNGYAAMYSGVSVDSFIKKITFQEVTKDGLERIANTVMLMAETEGLMGHKEAVAIRLNSLTNRMVQ